MDKPSHSIQLAIHLSKSYDCSNPDDPFMERFIHLFIEIRWRKEHKGMGDCKCGL